jgi:REP element-mobilizing transposase RayT
MNEHLAPEVRRELLGRWEPVYRSQLHYLVTWSTRGRRPVLRERHITALKTLIQQACDERSLTLVDASVAHEHVHVLVALSPSHSVASVVRELKGRTAVAMLTQFPELRVWLRGNLVWDERYAVETVSAMRLERVRERLRLMHGPDEELAAAS